MTTPHALEPEDLPAALALNQAAMPAVSHLDDDALAALVKMSFYCRGIKTPAGELQGFLLALTEGRDYDSLNYQWFLKRYARFAYIDRVVIAPEHAGQGLGRLLYADLEQESRAGGYPLLSCEVNVRPRNDASIAFHQRLGFAEVGQQETEGGKKCVSLMMKEL